ncbi:MAG TPA: class I SAM-dependent methyltransferase [Solirubrobacterales bacterium]|nr:class I SAM-dependent methyltransferase [Solirubrobacterales bacterium]
MTPRRDLQLRCALSDRADLRDGRLRALIKEVYSPKTMSWRLPFGRRSASDAEQRSRWEVAMALYAFHRLGVLDGKAAALVVGPQSGPAVDWLSARTDRLRSLQDPVSALAIDEEEGSFGAIQCSRTIERLGERDEARRACLELHRVLRPGGVAALSASFRLEGPAPGPPGLLLLDEPELRAAALGEGLTWAIASPLDLSASHPLMERRGRHAWTSVHLLLVKPLFH